jgi:hypothetical protein
VRWATLVVIVTLFAACNDLRDFRGTWQGPRVGDTPVLHIGPGDSATLSIDELDTHGIHAHLSIPGLITDTELSGIPGAEADTIANMTFSGNPLRVYLAFLSIRDGNGDAFALVALYDDQRVEVRVLRNGTQPIYAIFALRSA